MISIGLDLSLNSTGICVYDNEKLKTEYYIIGCKFTKKALATPPCGCLSLKTFEKIDADKKTEYHEKEWAKTTNIFTVVNIINEILGWYQPDICTIEGISFGSKGDVIGLSGLNYMVRQTILAQKKIPILYIVSPTQNKKFATGNGQADKDSMMAAWKMLDMNAKKISNNIKQDDIADAYFLARYGVELCSKQS